MTEHQHQKLSSLSATAKTNFYISALTALCLSDSDSDTTNRWIKTGKLYSQKRKLSTSVHDFMICSSQSGQIGRLARKTDSELLKHKAPATYKSVLRLTTPTSTMVPRMHVGLSAPATSPTIMARFHSALYTTSMNICTQARCYFTRSFPQLPRISAHRLATIFHTTIFPAQCLTNAVDRVL